MGYLESLLGGREVIALKARRHGVVILRTVLLNSLLAALIAVLVALLFPVTGGASLLGLLLWALPLGALLRDLLLWWNEIYVITNRRVIQLEGIIHKHSIDSSLEKVNDVVLDQSILGRLLNYGNVQILTASEMGINRIEKVGAPVRFKTSMLNQKEAMGALEAIQAGPAGGDIPSMIEKLDDLRRRGILTPEEFEREKQELLAKLGS